jgi:GMP reductase
MKVREFTFGINYSDIVLAPKFSIVASRSWTDTSLTFGNRSFKLPICPANMVCCVNTELARWMNENDYFYVMHRFDGKTTKKDLNWFVENANLQSWKTISVSIGVQEEDFLFIRWIYEKKWRVDFITIDIAHGHSSRMYDMLYYINQKFANSRKPFVIAGNIGTPAAVSDLEAWGADATKVGLAYGRACITKAKTGFATPMFSTVLDCAEVAKKPIVADGAIRENGDIAKALVAGATMTMAGNLFAACIDSPAENYWQNSCSIDPLIKNEITHKKYFGSASKHNGNNKNIEGQEVIIPCNGMTYQEKLSEIKEDLQSSLSYAGGLMLRDLKKVEWQVVGNYGQRE